MVNNSPAFQWYPKDMLTSARVALMNLKEEGAYRRAIDFCWLHGYIPADTVLLTRLLGKDCTTKIAEVVKTMFIPHPTDASKLIHDRLEAERKKQEDYRDRQRENGKRGGRPRKQDGDDDTGEEKGLGYFGETQTITQTEAKKSSAVSNLQSPSPVINDDDDDDARTREEFLRFKQKLIADSHFMHTCCSSYKLNQEQFGKAMNEFFEKKIAGLDYRSPGLKTEGDVRKNFMYWLPGFKNRFLKEKSSAKKENYANNNTQQPEQKYGRISESELRAFLNPKSTGH